MLIDSVDGVPYNPETLKDISLQTFQSQMQLFADMLDLLKSAGINHTDLFEDNILTAV